MFNSLITKTRENLKTPLYQTGYLLTLSSISSSGLGVLYWVLAARLFNVEVVGVNSALLSTLFFLSGISQFSLNGAFNRFIPVAGEKTKQLIIIGYLSSAGMSLLSGFIFIWGIKVWSPTLSDSLNSPIIIIYFLIAIGGWSIFSLQDSVLAGLKKSIWIPVENIVFAVLKIGLLIYFASTLSTYGIFLSWTIPMLIALIPINRGIFKKFIDQNVAESTYENITIREIAKFAAGNYAASLFYQAYTTLLPIIITETAGVQANAYFYLPWTITISIYQISVNMSISLTIEASKDRKHLPIYVRNTLSNSLRILVPIITILLIGANIFLSLFGKNYSAEGSNLLRLLTITALPHLLISTYIGTWRVLNRVDKIVYTQLALSVLILSSSYVLIQRLGILGVGIAWLGSHLIVSLIIFIRNRGNRLGEYAVK